MVESLSPLFYWMLLVIAIAAFAIAFYRRPVGPIDNKRRPLSLDEKVYVIEANVKKYGYARCVACGTRADFSFDHKIPLAEGGHNGLDNLQLLCKPCNSKKGGRI